MANPITTITNERLDLIARTGDATESEVRDIATLLIDHRNAAAYIARNDVRAAAEVRRVGKLLLEVMIDEIRGGGSSPRVDVLDVPMDSVPGSRLVRAHAWHYQVEMGSSICRACGARRTDKEIKLFRGGDDCAGSPEARIDRERDFTRRIGGGPWDVMAPP